MDRPMNKRKHPRFDTRFDALFSTGREEGAGVLVDISRSGARLEQSSLRPPIGSSVRLYVFVQPVSPFELIGTVVRSEDEGFSIAYDVESAEVRLLVDDVAALVSRP
jgi:hypothetical protein